MKTSDLLVTVLGVAGEGLAPVRALAAQAQGEGRPLQVHHHDACVCRETDREAEDYYHRYAVDNADTEAVDYHMTMSRKKPPARHRRDLSERKRYAGGLSSHPLIGRPEKNRGRLLRLQAAASTGSPCRFVNFKNELPSSSTGCCRCSSRRVCDNKAGL